VCIWSDPLLPDQQVICPVAPELQRCSKPRSSRVAIRNSVTCPVHLSSQKVHLMTSGYSMQHPPLARGRSWQSLSDYHSGCGEPPASVESYPFLDTTNPSLEAYQLLLRQVAPCDGPATTYLLGSWYGLLR
jgi:hypothetical protein